jgi:hypothetical protein
MNVTPLRTKDLTPSMVLGSALESSLEWKSVYIVGINKEGQAEMYAAGDLNDLAYAALSLQSLALTHVNGGIEQE